MNFLSKRIALTALLAACVGQGHAATRVSYTGAFETAPQHVLADPTLPNRLAGLLGSNFTASLTWDPAEVLASSTNDGDSTAIWALPGRGSLSIAGQTITPEFTFVSTRNDFYYDGSFGVLPAGFYDEITLSGAQGCAATGPQYFGTCVAVPGAPARWSYSIVLIGSASMLADAGLSLPTAALFDATRLLAVGAELDLMENGNELVGALETLSADPTRLTRLSLTEVAVVPEPATYLFMCAGLIALRLRSRPVRQAGQGLRPRP